MESILSNDKDHCYICKAYIGLYNRECHHIFGGTANRKLSDAWGCFVWLCHECHNEPKYRRVRNGITYVFDGGVHHNRVKDLKLKRECQEEFERRYGHDKFMEVFGKDYGEV